MKKTGWIVGCAVGVFAMILSVVLTICSVNSRINEGMGIIGGADWPTFVFYFETQYMWLAIFGLAVVAISAIGFLLTRKK